MGTDLKRPRKGMIMVSSLMQLFNVVATGGGHLGIPAKSGNPAPAS